MSTFFLSSPLCRCYVIVLSQNSTQHQNIITKNGSPISTKNSQSGIAPLSVMALTPYLELYTPDLMAPHHAAGISPPPTHSHCLRGKVLLCNLLNQLLHLVYKKYQQHDCKTEKSGIKYPSRKDQTTIS